MRRPVIGPPISPTPPCRRGRDAAPRLHGRQGRDRQASIGARPGDHADAAAGVIATLQVVVEAADHGRGQRTRGRDLAALHQAIEEGRLRALRPFGRPRESCFEFAAAQFAGTYLNFFVPRTRVLTARFGDEQEDPRAESQLREFFPGREIRLLDINAILRGGGSIRCLTQPLPS